MMTRQSAWIDRGLLLVRVALAVVFIAHGAQKLFVVGFPGITGFLGSLGLPFPAVSAALLIAVELGGGIALLAGAFTRIAALLIGLNMIVATVTVHLANGFFLPTGYEFTLTLMLVSAAMTMMGAGAYSVDALWQGRQRREATVAYKAAA